MEGSYRGPLFFYVELASAVAGGVRIIGMSFIKPQNRPDYAYWTTKWQDRKSLSSETLNAILTELREYSLLKFPIGQRFKLSKEYNSIPKGTGCTVIEDWPHTAVRWDKWANTGRGSERAVQNVLFELDMHLEEM